MHKYHHINYAEKRCVIKNILFLPNKFLVPKTTKVVGGLGVEAVEDVEVAAAALPAAED